MNLGL
jgi:hypothetical protein